MKEKRMLVAVRSGFVDDPHTGLEEITAGAYRIAPEVLAERPQYAEFFEPDVAQTCRSGDLRARKDGRTVALYEIPTPDGDVRLVS